MSTFKPPQQPSIPLWTSLVQYYRACISREQELSLQAPANTKDRVLLQGIDEHLITRKATTTILTAPEHTQPTLAYLNRRGRGITGSFIYGFPLAKVGENLFPLCYTEVKLEPGTAPQTVVLTRGVSELLFNRRFFRCAAGLTDGEIDELQRALLSPRSRPPAEVLRQYLVEVDVVYDAILFAAETHSSPRGPVRELQLMEQLRKDRLPDVIRIFTGEQGLPAPKPSPDYLTILPADGAQAQVLQRWKAPFLAVSGPAGSGKSRTAVNLVATAAAEGQRVLYISLREEFPNELAEAYPGLLKIGSKEAWIESLRCAQSVVEGLHEPGDAPDAAPSELAKESAHLGQEVARLQESLSESHRLTALMAELEPVGAQVEAALAHHPRRAAFEALAQRITPATAGQFRPEQLHALRDLLVRALSWEQDGSFGGMLKERRRTGQIKTTLREAGVPEFCHPEGDLRAQIESLALLVQAYPLLLLRARQLHSQSTLSNQQPAAARESALREISERKVALDRRRLRLAWQRLADRTRPHLDVLEAAIAAELEALEGGKPQRSAVSRQRFSDLLGAFPVVYSPHLAVAGIIPNEPELFDLLVLDDANLADIPSLLPVLYRAKRAVIIGDEQGPRPSSCLGANEDSRLLGQVAAHNLAPFAYTEMTPVDRALGVVQAQALRLTERYRRTANPLELVDAAGGETVFPAAEAYSQAQNPTEAREVVIQITQLLSRGVRDIVIFTPFRGQALLLEKLLRRLSEVEPNASQAGALRQIPVKTLEDDAERHQAVIMSLVAGKGATPEMLSWLEGQGERIHLVLASAAEHAILITHREIVAGRLPFLAGEVPSPTSGLQPARLGLLRGETAQHQAFITLPGVLAEACTDTERELISRLGGVVRGRGLLLAPRLALATALEPEQLRSLTAEEREAAVTAHPLVTLIDAQSLEAVAVVELDQGEESAASRICGQAGLRHVAVRPGDWDGLSKVLR